MSKDISERDHVLFNAMHGKPDFCKQRQQPLEIMLLGLSRTGTSCTAPTSASTTKEMTLCYNVSLTCSLPYLALYEAFSILGHGTIYNTREVLRRHQERSAVAALDAKYARHGRKFGIK